MSSKRMTMGDFLRPPPQQPPPITAAVRKAVPNNHNPPPEAATPTTTTPYRIRATKKGGVPCAVESRKHHKVVTLSNIEGDVGALLSALQKSLGTGGVRRGDSTIEVQGEHHLEKIRTFCLKSGCVVGATKQSKAEVEAATSKRKGKANDNTAKSETTAGTSKPAVIISGTGPLSQKEIKAMKPATLKNHLAARELSTQGNKKELVARLVEASASSSALPAQPK